MSQQQLDMLDYLETLVDYFLRAGGVTTERLGRAGEKFSKLTKCAFNLRHQDLPVEFEDVHSFLEVLQKSFDGYGNPKRKPKTSPDEMSPGLFEKDCAEVALEPLVRLPMQTTSTLPVRSERIKWKLAPTFDPSPFLSDPVVRAAFKQPDVLRRPKLQWPSLPKAIVHAARSDILELAEKWDSLEACHVVPCSQVREVETVGMFCVPKDADWDRLILNPTVINSRDEKLLISSDDLCEFYHTFKVSSARADQVPWF